MGLLDFFKGVNTDKSKDTEISETTNLNKNILENVSTSQSPDSAYFVETDVNLRKGSDVLTIEVDINKMLNKKVKHKPKKFYQELINSRLFKVDLSFIPSKKLTVEVKSASKKKMIKRRGSENLLFEIHSDDLELNVIHYQRNFSDYIHALGSLGNKLYKEKDIETAFKIYNYLIELQEIRMVSVDYMFEQYIYENNIDKIYQLARLIIDEIRYLQKNPDLHNHKWWHIKVKYSEYFGGLDDVLLEMRNALRKVTMRYDAYDIYNWMAVLLTKYKKHKEAITAHLLNYYYGIDYNSHYRGNDVDYFLAKESIERDLKKFLKGTPYETKQKELTEMFKDYLTIRNNALGVLETNVNLICEN